MDEIRSQHRIEAAPEAIWALLVDADSWTRWAGYDSVAVDGTTEAGTQRRCVSGETVVVEVVTIDEDRRRYSYRHVSGLPVHSYTGEITLKGNGATTRVDWHARIEPLMADSRGVVAVVRAAIERACDGLARAVTS